ncbi:MAG TPA: PmoA family protein [Armatimonadota bacterium]|jgi:hypothetical protein
MNAYPEGTILHVKAGPHERRGAWVALPAGADPGGGNQTWELLGAGREPLACGVAQRVGEELILALPDLPAEATAELRLREALPEEIPGVSVRRGEGAWDFLIGDELFTTVVVRPEAARPYCYPLRGPGGVGMTNLGPADHRHHRSLYSAHGSVNGADNWSEAPEHARTANRAAWVVSEGPVCGELALENDWETADGSKLLAESLRLRVYATGDDCRVLDWDLTWKAAYGSVFFGDTKEAGTLAVRVAESLEGSRGGRIVNGYGAVGETECWGQPAPWVDYSGLCEGRAVGIALFDHPDNFRYPTPWHVRDYGLFAANCWGLHDFAEDWSVRGDYALARGESLHWRFRVCLHEGDEQQGRVAARYLDFAYPPRVGVLV